ncbi:methyltransferase-like protein 11a [Stylonychia lemnae]|uniref:Alpha N-terminal protein methyltransferase 1 n=1 Tax=Stylonychia lemnae TaxID=5949 RepID=A0A077ZYJ7_STYLE|nr:methyltransferase-like protein 11a [Stylonychia lemnae]|eukprot:CDW75016.1 methyltransferase-like protein 11a [Stylonychia lemnae]
MWQKELRINPDSDEGEADEDEEEDDEEIINRVGNRDNWYKKQVEFWSTQEASINGVLTGYGDCHPADAETSNNLLDGFKKTIGIQRALDCGAGIGRVTKYILESRFEKIDLLDPTKELLAKARDFIGSDKVDKIYCTGLQDFEFEYQYDCIWVQWVLCYLTDKDIRVFLRKCSQYLRDENSLLICKENVHDDSFYVDKEDNSVIRSDKLFQEIFEEEGFCIVKHQIQPGFPDNLFTISIYALKYIKFGK